MARLRNGLTAAQNRILCEVWETGFRIYHGAQHDVAISMLEQAGLVEVDRDWPPLPPPGHRYPYDQLCRITVWAANETNFEHVRVAAARRAMRARREMDLLRQYPEHFIEHRASG